jgi:fatty acid metabolism transcriptional regulator FadR
VPFSPVKRLKVAEQIVSAIRGAIVKGQYEEGDSLPSERELATQFGVNRSSIREALLRLEAWGLVHIRQGGATRVRNVFYSAGVHILPYLIAPDGRIDAPLLADILSVRGMFLAWTAEQAALRASAQDVATLRSVVDQLGASESPTVAQQLDFDFFERLVKVSGNRVLTLFTNSLREIYLENSKTLLFLYQALPFDISMHRETVDAIERGDSDTAAAAMKQYAKIARLRGGTPQ